MINRILFPAAAWILTAAALFADSAAEGEQRVRKAVDESIEIAAHASDHAVLMEKLRPLLEKNMSFPAMTRRAIGPGWRKFSPEQQKKAIELFSDLIIRRYVNRFTIGENPSVVYKPVTTPAPGRMELPTKFLYKGSPYEVIYRLEQSENWRVTDIVVEGVSFIGNYRSQFDAQYQKGGPEAVLASMAKSRDNSK